MMQIGATAQKYGLESGFAEPTARIRGAMAFGLWWMDTFGDTSYGRKWEKSGLPQLEPHEVSVAVAPQPAGAAGDGALEVRVAYTLAPPRGRARVRCRSRFVLSPGGELAIRHTAEVPPGLAPVNLPRTNPNRSSDPPPCGVPDPG
jgi:hypothetical protein